MEECCELIKGHYGIETKSFTLSKWLKEFSTLCRYSRMREFGKRLFSPNQIIQSVTLYHRQIFNFRYHKAKTVLILQDFKHAKFEPLREFLNYIAVECPHQYFKEGARSSEIRTKFNLNEAIIKGKSNYAVRIADFVLQAVSDNRQRHEILQKFMLANDSVTVACEVPVYFDREDLEHMKTALRFDIPIELESVLTGHIDIVQIRNGAVHLLDYKPNASKEKPIEQLTIYALALSRLTGLRLYDFKCAWFDENYYFEFFPLHVVYKTGKKRLKIDRHQMRLENK